MTIPTHSAWEHDMKVRIGLTLYDLCNAGSIPNLREYLPTRYPKNHPFKVPILKMMEIAVENSDTALTKYCLSEGGRATESIMKRIALNRPYRFFEDLLPSTYFPPDYVFSHGATYCTVATYAATANDFDFVKLCLAHGAQTRDTDFENYPTALAAIAEKASIEMVALWLEHGAELEGSGAIVAAAGAGRIDMVKYLLGKGANVNEVNYRPRGRDIISMKIGGALHWAARNQHEEMVALLIEKGGDKDMVDAKGRRPFFYAYTQGNEKIKKMLAVEKYTTE